MEDRDSARIVNGTFPGTDALEADIWAEVFGVGRGQVLRLFKEHKTPRKGPGKRVFARPQDVWESLPWTTESEPKEA